MALNQAGGLTASHPAFQRGIQFLLRTQFEGGSWFVQSRSFPTQRYFESGFPHGKSQFISAAATSWATMALVLATSDAATKLTLGARHTQLLGPSSSRTVFSLDNVTGIEFNEQTGDSPPWFTAIQVPIFGWPGISIVPRARGRITKLIEPWSASTIGARVVPIFSEGMK